MKKIYLLPAMLLFAGSTFGQMQAERKQKHIEPNPQSSAERPTTVSSDRAEGDIIAESDFSVAADWITPTDANNYAWLIQNTTPADITQYMGAMASTTASNGFASFAGISLLLNAATTPFGTQDVVVEYVPTIDCSVAAGVSIEFEQRYRAFNSDSCIVEVSGDGGTTWEKYSINQEIATNAAATQSTKSINISAVAGNSANVKIRFRWVGTDDQQFGAGYGWMVDDVRVIESWNYESEIVSPKYRMGVGGNVWPDGLDYHFITDLQKSEIEFSAEIQNNGGLTQVGSFLSADITGVATYNGTSPTADIPLIQTDSFVVSTTFTPSVYGVYDLEMTANQTNPDFDPTNNSFTTSFELNDEIYGRDNGIEQGGISNFASNSGLSFSIGNMMEIFGDGIVYFMDIVVTNESTNVGETIYGTIYRADAGGFYNQEIVTVQYEVTAADLQGNPIRLAFEEDAVFPVSAGDDLLVMAAHLGGDDVEFASAQPVETGTVRGVSEDGSIGTLSSPSAVMVRLVMPDNLNVEESEVSSISVNQNQPNPFADNTVITYNLNETANVSVEVIDVTGKVVATYNEGTQGSGEYKLNISADKLSSGVYFYNFKAGNYSVTKRMVVNK